MRSSRDKPRFKDPSEFTSAAQVTAETARALDLAASHYAHGMYWHKEFQRLGRLDDLNQTERDRIFNELVLGCIVLIMLSFEAPDLRAGRDMKGLFKDICDALPTAQLGRDSETGLRRHCSQ